MTEITDEAIEAAARELCRHGTSFPTIEHTLSWVDEKWPRFTDEASLALYAALPFLSSRSAEAGKPVVKGLEWGLINGWWFAPTAEGQKYIVRASSATNFKGQWLWGLGVETYDLEPSLDAAKAAAQADYERRVISALSTPADIEPVSVPEGWQLVPKRPTEDMLDAALGVKQLI